MLTDKCKGCCYLTTSQDISLRLLCGHPLVLGYWRKKYNNPRFYPAASYEIAFGEQCKGELLKT